MQQRIQQLLESQSGHTLEQMAKRLDTSVRDIIAALPGDMAAIADSEQLWALIDELPHWGRVTVIVQNAGSVFEFKGDFPRGTIAHGYYNFMHHRNPFHGHLLVEGLAEVAFVSKPHRGAESHSLVFLSPAGDCVFKVFLGRDEERRLIPEQVEKFKQQKQQLARASAADFQGGSHVGR